MSTEISCRFEPKLMHAIAEIFNRSSTAQYLVSYKKPNKIINFYKFDVEKIFQFLTSMHGSSEGHTCYIYRRVGTPGIGATEDCVGSEVPCDPLFKEAWETCKYGGFDAVNNHVAAKVDKFYKEKPVRNRKQVVKFGS